MHIDDIKTRLADLQNRHLISAFAARSGVNRRTLQRLMAGDQHKQGPHAVTLDAIVRTMGLKMFSAIPAQQEPK
jgi:DNA-binding phage protein